MDDRLRARTFDTSNAVKLKSKERWVNNDGTARVQDNHEIDLSIKGPSSWFTIDDDFRITQ